jgi:hypothetical protein
MRPREEAKCQNPNIGNMDKDSIKSQSRACVQQVELLVFAR